MTLRNVDLEELSKSKLELAVIYQISQVFLTVPDDEMYGDVLQIVLKVMDSKYGVFGFIDQDGALVCPSLTRDAWSQCQVPDKAIVFPRESWSGIWGKALMEKRTLFANHPLTVPEGHVPINRTLVVPIIYKQNVIGTLFVANKKKDYNADDRNLLESIASQIAPILDARLKGNREEMARKQAEESLKKKAHELNERVKELNCLYGISKIVEENGSLDSMLQDIVDIIPKSCQYPELTSARILLEGKEYRTKNFKDCPWKQSAHIKINGKHFGLLEVCCHQNNSNCRNSLFLEEEIALISAIADRIGHIIDRYKLENERNELFDNLQNALTKILSGYLPICAACKKIRDENGVWHQVEVYVRDHTEATFSHGICPECKAKLYPKY
jgi:GAF domain-containing protein